MGHQLWTSPITGYRRKGTRLSELRELFDTGITISGILEPLQSCPQDAKAAEMASVLHARDFDVAGVQVIQSGPVIGFVEKNKLVGGFVRRPRPASNSMSSSFGVYATAGCLFCV